MVNRPVNGACGPHNACLFAQILFHIEFASPAPPPRLLYIDSSCLLLPVNEDPPPKPAGPRLTVPSRRAFHNRRGHSRCRNARPTGRKYDALRSGITPEPGFRTAMAYVWESLNPISNLVGESSARAWVASTSDGCTDRAR